MSIKVKNSRSRFVAMATLLGLSAFALAACTPSQRSVSGDNVGRLVVIADDSVSSDVILSVNGQYLNTLANKRKFEQAVCAGEYTVQASSTKVRLPEPSHSIVRTDAQSKVVVEKGKVTYLSVSQTAKGWGIAPADENALANAKNHTEKDGKLVRRLPDYMINCK